MSIYIYIFNQKRVLVFISNICISCLLKLIDVTETVIKINVGDGLRTLKCSACDHHTHETNKI